MEIRCYRLDPSRVSHFSRKILAKNMPGGDKLKLGKSNVWHVRLVIFLASRFARWYFWTKQRNLVQKCLSGKIFPSPLSNAVFEI